MTIAKGLYKQTVVGIQTALGTPKTGSGGQILRRKTSTFNATRAITANDEIASHMQDTGVTYGQKSLSGKLEGNLSPLTYSVLFQQLLRKDFAATAASTGLSVTIAGTGPYTVTRGSGSWLTDGVKAGDIGRLTAGAFNASNLNNNLLITSLTATILTVVTLNNSSLVAEGPIASATFTVTGKKSYAPVSGQTNKYLTFEDWYSDISRSELFPDCKISQAQINLPSSGAATVSFDIVGIGTRTLNSTQQMTTPGAETTTNTVEAVRGMLYVNNAKVATATSAQLTIDSGVTPMAAVIGSVVAADLNQSRLKVSGSFTGQFDGATLQTLFDNETAVSLILVAATDASNNADFLTITLGRIKFTGDAPDDGEKEIIRTYNFVAELNGAGGAALAWDNTIISMQDSAA
jgi:hypothetical protein